FGPPEELLAFFGASDYAEVFGLITDDPDTWADRYRQSPLYDRYVTKQMARSVAAVTMPAPASVPAPVSGRAVGPGPVGPGPVGPGPAAGLGSAGLAPASLGPAGLGPVG